VLVARGRHHAWSGVGSLSIKSFRGGRARYAAGPGTFAVDERSYLVLNQGQEYSIALESETPVESLCVFFEAALAADVLRGRLQNAGQLLDAPDAHAAGSPRFFERTYPNDDDVTPGIERLRREVGESGPLWLEERLHELLRALLRVHGGAEREARALPAARASTRDELYRRLHRAREFLAASFAERVGLREAARAACLSPNHLLRTFPALFGCTPHAWLTRRRIEAARELLARGEHDVTETCLAVGFESPASFTRLFQRHVGVSPAAFRTAAREKGDRGQARRQCSA